MKRITDHIEADIGNQLLAMRNPQSGATFYISLDDFRAICAFVRSEKQEKPIAWYSELADSIDAKGNYCDWKSRITMFKPNVPPGSIRNLMPLYGEKSNDT